MKPRLEDDLKRLSKVAFQREEKVRQLVRRYHEVYDTVHAHPDASVWNEFYPWLFVPLALWPIDLDGLGQHLLDVFVNGQKLDRKLLQIVGWLHTPPEYEACTVISAHEQAVRNGNYESLVVAQHKFDGREKELNSDPEFQASWAELKKHFDVKNFQNRRGVIRRRMVQERNFRTDWDFRWQEEADQFSAAFDAFCYRWHLYGMEYDKPLLLKLSVNITPHGTLLMIPRYWSFDSDRDLKWKEITELHKSRGVQRQGVKLSSNKKELLAEAKKAQAFQAEGRKIGLKGQRLFDWIVGKMKWSANADPSKLKRLLKIKT